MKLETQHTADETSRARFGGGLARIVVLLACSLFLAAAAYARTITVTSTSDTIAADGVVTLREAITAANTNLAAGDAPKGDLGLDTINFNIAGGGVKTIVLITGLPTITEPIIINGYSQPGASPNTLAVGSDAKLLIELNGAGAGANASGLIIDAGGCTIKGLIINRFHLYGIYLLAKSGNLITGNFIGTTADGTAALPPPNNSAGVYVTSSVNTIGGVNPADRNVISGNATQADGTGVYIDSTFANSNNVIGNYVGTNASGTAAVPNARDGVQIRNGKFNLIGGFTPAERNIISGNFNYGVGISDAAANNQVRGNYIGTKTDGVSALGNAIGVSFVHTVANNTVGGTAGGAGNVIAFSKLVGVEVNPLTINNAILGNAIFGNGTVAKFPGIDLFTGGYGPTPNDDNTGDADAGANNLQNFPVLTSVLIGSGITTIQGTLDSAPNKQFRVEFFSNTSCDGTGFGEGEKFLGFANVTTNAAGDASFTSTVSTAAVSSNFFAATATDPNGNTSEFSACKQAEAGSFTFSSASYTVSEKGGGINITVLRTGASTGPVSVKYSTSNGTAQAGSDYSAVSGTLQFPNGVTSQTFKVNISDDSIYEDNETIKLALSVPDGGATLGNPSSATVTILEDDQPPTISINDLSLVEGDNGTTSANFTVSLSNDSYQQITVSYTTGAGGTATSGSDYQPVSGTLTFSPGWSTQSIAVSVNGDTLFEPDEIFFVQLSNPVNASIAKAQGTGTITNDDASSSGSFNFTAASYSVNEDGGNATITVKRTGGSDGAVSVHYATSNGTAAANSDYTNAGGTLSWADGDTADKTFTIAITNDVMDELDETVNVALSNPTGGASMGNPSSAVLTITDDDAQPAISISDLSQGEGNSGTTIFSFNVTLSTASGQSVTVDYLSADGTALVGADYQAASGTLTFAPGETTRSFSVIVNGDTQDEPTETFVVNLSNPTGATIAKAQGTGTVVNDDSAAGPSIQFSQATYAVAEQLGAMTVTVTRSGDVSNTASVDYATADGSAAQKSDFEYAAGTLNFTPGEVSKTFVVLLNQDSYIEGPESFNLVLSNAVGAALGAQAVSQVSIADDLPEMAANPIDDAETFVYMHYHDFLNREPDPAGLAFWTNEITSCGNDAQCIDAKRINVSAAFFLSIEFQETGYLRYLMQKESFGSTPKYAEFMRDLQEVSRGVVVKAPGWEQKLKDNQLQFAEKWIARPEFKAVYDGLSNDDYVTALYKNAGIVAPQAEQDKLVAALNAAGMNRAAVLLDIANDATFRQQEQNAAFVLMEYFGYLRRDPNAAPDSDLSGYNFWLSKLNQFGGNYIDAEMIKAFITSFEYRQRFAQ